MRRPRVLLVLLSLIPALAFAAPRDEGPRIDPEATRQLKQMSDYLSSLRSFRVDTQAVDEAVTKQGQKLQFVADSRISVERPNRLRADRVGPMTHIVFRYDGQHYTVFGKRTGYYAIAPAPATLDAAIDDVRAKYGIDAPAADLFLSRPYDELMDGVRSARYIGVEPIDGVPCHHLAFQGTDTDWQIWIEAGPQPLPRRYVITTKDLKNQPQFTVSLKDWQPNAPIDAREFAFTPPSGAKQIDLLKMARARSERQGGE